MEWLRDYFSITLFFWRDKKDITLEQFTFLPGIYGGIFYSLYSKMLGSTLPKYSLANYVFPTILMLIIIHYLTDQKRIAFLDNIFRFFRVCILHICFSFLFFVSVAPFSDKISEEITNSLLLKTGIGFATLLLMVHTIRAFPITNYLKNESSSLKKYIMYIFLSGIGITLFSWLFNLYFVLPKQN
jgi:hypothetical protein